MVNQSKIRDPRFWNIWRESGAVGNLQSRQTRNVNYIMDGHIFEGDVENTCGVYSTNSRFVILGEVRGGPYDSYFAIKEYKKD